MARYSMYSGEQIETHDSDFDSRVPGVVHRQTQNGDHRDEDLALLRTSRENVLSRHGHNGTEGSHFFTVANLIFLYLEENGSKSSCRFVAKNVVSI